MKIIKIGNVEPSTRRKICYYCSSEFEYDTTDIKYDRDGDYVICPVCDKFLNINNFKLGRFNE